MGKKKLESDSEVYWGKPEPERKRKKHKKKDKKGKASKGEKDTRPGGDAPSGTDATEARPEGTVEAAAGRDAHGRPGKPDKAGKSGRRGKKLRVYIDYSTLARPRQTDVPAEPGDVTVALPKARAASDAAGEAADAAAAGEPKVTVEAQPEDEVLLAQGEKNAPQPADATSEDDAPSEGEREEPAEGAGEEPADGDAPAQSGFPAGDAPAGDAAADDLVEAGSAERPSYHDALSAPGRDEDDTELEEGEIARLKARAAAGDRAAMRSLGNRYQAGNGVPQSYDLMREWWERAAQAGNTTAMWDLGYYYLIGKYLDQDVDRGLAWFSLAIENGNADAAFQLALYYGTGMFVEQNYDLARKLFARALELGREDAREEMAECERALAEGSEHDVAGSVRGGNIVLDHVSRNFGRKVVLDDITLTIKGGELVAIVGSSGGGKSTLGSIILGTLRPTHGRVVFGGRLGFVPQRNLVHENLTVAQQLDFYARAVKHLPRQKARERVDRVVRELGLQKVRRTLIRKCSGGEKRRVSVACELLSFPDGLVLDEPTSGLDPGDSGNLVAVLHSLVHNRHMTALVINHDYENIQLFDKICFLAHGKVCFYGTPVKLFEYFDTRSTREIYTLMDKDPYPFIRRFEEWRRDHPDELGGIC